MVFKRIQRILLQWLVPALLLTVSGQSTAAQCEQVKLSGPGWTDISATNGIATILLEGLGYQPEVTTLGVPITFKSLTDGQIDVFLGNWMPAQQSFRDQYGDQIDIIRPNLKGAKFTLAVPDYVYEAGVQNFADLAGHADQFEKTIYGIEPGAPANQKLQSMIESGDFGLGEWKLLESGEQAMLSQVGRAVQRNNFVVFLAWEPHPMNVNHDIRYLSGGDEYFGPNLGGATIYTVTRQGYSDQCPNVGRLLENLTFTLTMENELIGAILNDNAEPGQAAKAWLSENPQVLNDWLDGVKTINGEPGLAAVKSHIGL